MVSECERVNEVDLRIYSHIFDPDLHQYILIACVSEKVKSDMIDRLYAYPMIIVNSKKTTTRINTQELVHTNEHRHTLSPPHTS